MKIVRAIFCGVLVACLASVYGEPQTWSAFSKGALSPAFGFAPSTYKPYYGSPNGLLAQTPIGVHTETPYESTCTYPISDELVLEFRRATYRFTLSLYKGVTLQTDRHFVFSPLSIWLSMAAVAEATEGLTRQQLFNILNLPEDVCLRQTFYRLAVSRETPSNNVALARNRLFITDSEVEVNNVWQQYVQSQTYLNTVSVPFKANPLAETDNLRRVFKAELSGIDLTGNSIFLESLDYNGLWTSAFTEAAIEVGPFYNIYGQQIGTLEYMKTSKRVNIGVIPSIDMKVIELPVGGDGRFRLLIAQSNGRENFGRFYKSIDESLIFETLANLKESAEPVEIVIPRITISSEINVKKALDSVIGNVLWADPSATRNVSTPSAQPSTYIQRTTVQFDNGGVRPVLEDIPNFTHSPTHQHIYNRIRGYLPALPETKVTDNTFIANKPFLFSLLDLETFSIAFTGSFSKLV